MSANTFMCWLARSPLHGMISKSVLLVTYRGLKSRKTYTTPVNYVEIEPGVLLVTSTRTRMWWRNLRGAAAVTLRLRGKDVAAIGEALEDAGEVAEGLLSYLSSAPQYARYFKVGLDEDGLPRRADVERVMAERVVVRFRLTA